MSGEVKQDFSSFMTVLIMAIGSLVIVLVCNVVVIISNPDNLSISTLVLNSYENPDDEELSGKMGQPLFGNVTKQPTYIDVYDNKIVIYPEKSTVPLADLEVAENAFEKLLEKVHAARAAEYIILVVRPGSANMVRVIRNAVISRGIDVGQELYETGKEMKL